MNAIHTLAGRPARWLALAALAALLALAAALALSAAQPAEAQTTTNLMQAQSMEGTIPHDDRDRSNFRLELSLDDDSDGTVPAGSSAKVKVVFKFDVPKSKTNGTGLTAADDPNHGDFGRAFTLQDGGTLRIAGPYEWENAGGRTLRLDPNRIGWADADGSRADTSRDSDDLRLSGTDCGAFDDWNNIYDRVTLPAATESGGTYTAVACVAPGMPSANVVTTPATDEGWRTLGYSNRGYYGNSDTMDLLPDRDGHQGWCTASTTDDLTTWSCEIPVIDEQFGWLGHNNYRAQNGDYDNFGSAQWGLVPARRDLNAQDGTITIPAGTPDGAFTISASISLHTSPGLLTSELTANTGKITITDSLTVNIGTVAEAKTAPLTFAPQTAALQPSTGAQVGSPWPSVIAADGGETYLLLSILNENGKASARNSVSYLNVRADGNARLNSTNPSVGDCNAPATAFCVLDQTKLDTTNSAAILIRVRPPANKRAGTTTVQGTVQPTSGAPIPLGPVEITFTGAASTLTVSEPASSILNVNTEPANDNRDRLTLSVSAVDASDNKASVPGGTTTVTTSRSTTVKDPDGKTVTQGDAGIRVTWPLAVDNTPTLDAAGNLQLRIDVGAAAASALKAGVYSLEVRAGSLKDTVNFTVAGAPTGLDLAVSESEFRGGEEFTLTATVTTEGGSSVPDGTTVTWRAGPTAPGTTGSSLVVQLRADTATKDGQATARYVVIAQGRAWITATAGGNATDFWSGDVGAPLAPPEPADPVENLSARAGFASYLGMADTTAKALLDGLGNVNAIRIWQVDRWQLYAVVDGISPPGAGDDFAISRGDVLWIGS